LQLCNREENRLNLFESGLIRRNLHGNLGSVIGHEPRQSDPLPEVDDMSKVSAAQVLRRVRAEYLEMPGLSLTASQVQRLCGVDQGVCETALTILVESGFLSMRPDGAYGRFRNPDISRARPAAASLEPSVLATMSRVRARAS
jgi:hypothetical protein